MIAFFASLYKVVPGRYFTVLISLGDVPYRYPFLDLESILQAGACARQGVAVYAANARMHGGTYNYAPLLLHFAWPTIGAQDRVAGGLVTLIAYSLTLSLLPPAADSWELATRCLAAMSPAVIFGAERGNFDLIVFCLVVIGVALSFRGPAMRLAGYTLLALGGALKFYPVAALILILRERPLYFLSSLGFLASLAVLYAATFGGGTVTALHNLPGGPPFGYWFGSTNIAYGVALLNGAGPINLNPDITQYRAIMLHGDILLLANIAVLLMNLAAAGLAFRRAARIPTISLSQPDSFFLVAGAAVVVVCFFAAQNVVYREAFFLMILPAVFRRDRLLCFCTLGLLWEEALRRLVAIGSTAWLGVAHGIYAKISFWLLREAIWWWVIIELGAILVSFVWRRPSIEPKCRSRRAKKTGAFAPVRRPGQAE